MRFNSGFSKDSKLEIIRILATEFYNASTSRKKGFDNQLHFWFSEDENETNDIYTYIDENGEHVMVMGIGLIEDIYSYVYTAFSSNEVIPFLGKADQERNTLIEAHYKEGDLNLSDTPLDERRKEAAEKTAQYMMYFIIDHELSHLTNGHNAYLKRTYGRSLTKMQEDNTDCSGPYVEDRKILEYDADMTASSLMEKYLLNECRLFDYRMGDFEVADVIFVIGGFAIYSIFALCSRKTLHNQLYLPLEERIYHSIGNIKELVDESKFIAMHGEGLSYKYGLLKIDLTNGCNYAAEFAKKKIDPEMKNMDEIWQNINNADCRKRWDAINEGWLRLLQDVDLRESAVDDLYDPEEYAKMLEEKGFPPDWRSQF